MKNVARTLLVLTLVLGAVAGGLSMFAQPQAEASPADLTAACDPSNCPPQCRPSDCKPQGCAPTACQVATP